MLACVCADAAAQSRLLSALVGGLAVSCSDLEGLAEADGSENTDIPPDRAIWCECEIYYKNAACHAPYHFDHSALFHMQHCLGQPEALNLDRSPVIRRAADRFIGLMLSDAAMRGALLSSGLLLALLPALEAAAANDTDASVAALQMSANMQALPGSDVGSQALLVCARAAVHADLAATAACSSDEGPEGVAAVHVWLLSGLTKPHELFHAVPVKWGG